MFSASRVGGGGGVAYLKGRALIRAFITFGR